MLDVAGGRDDQIARRVNVMKVRGDTVVIECGERLGGAQYRTAERIDPAEVGDEDFVTRSSGVSSTILISSMTTLRSRRVRYCRTAAR